MTNNPDKVESLRGLGIKITDRVPLETPANPHNVDYLKTKVARLNHALTIDEELNASTGGNGSSGSHKGH
jgi:3,4-dihydroxy 2-butanone 4-phosphate synthase / GTP cyclohydrolase II